MDPILKMSLLISSHRFKYTTQGHTAGNLEKTNKHEIALTFYLNILLHIALFYRLTGIT